MHASSGNLMTLLAPFIGLFFVLSQFSTKSMAIAGPSLGPSGTKTYSPVPSASSTQGLCKPNNVQCCSGKAENGTSEAESVLSTYGILNIDTSSEKGWVKRASSISLVGWNCTSISDEDASDGYCDDNVLCCTNLYNGTQTSGYGNVGTSCKDVAVAQ